MQRIAYANERDVAIGGVGACDDLHVADAEDPVEQALAHADVVDAHQFRLVGHDPQQSLADEQPVDRQPVAQRQRFDQHPAECPEHSQPAQDGNSDQRDRPGSLRRSTRPLPTPATVPASARAACVTASPSRSSR